MPSTAKRPLAAQGSRGVRRSQLERALLVVLTLLVIAVVVTAFRHPERVTAFFGARRC